MAMLRRLLVHNERSRGPVLVSIVGDIAKTRKLLILLLGEEPARQVHLVKKNSLTGLWAYWRSDHIFFTHGLYLSSRLPAKQTVINLWHGMPLKAIWKADTRQEFNAVQACTHMTCTSPLYADLIQNLTDLPRQVLKDTGLPRNDLLFSATPAVQAFRRSCMEGGFAQLAVCLPTFRQTKGQHKNRDGSEGENALMMAPAELGALQALLAAARVKLLVKPHPLSVHHGTERSLTPNIQVVSDSWMQLQGVTLYEVLGQADFLITDVSSVYIDYLALNRPVFFFFPDLTTYRETRGFVFEPIEEWLAGRICTTAGQLLAELGKYAAGDDSHREARVRLASRLNPQKDPVATLRLLALLGLPDKKGASG